MKGVVLLRYSGELAGGRGLMERRIWMTLVYSLFVTTVRAQLNGSPSCPYDFSTLKALTPLCQGTSWSSSADLTLEICCREIYSAALFAIARYTNATGRMFLNRSQAEVCVRNYEEELQRVLEINQNLLGSCPLPASRITRGASSCHFGTKAELERTYDIRNVCKACGEGLEVGHKNCQTCQGQLLLASLELANRTGDDPGACGTSIAAALTSLNLDIAHFESFFTCALQILENVPVSEYFTDHHGEAPSPEPAVSPAHRRGALVVPKVLIIIAGIFGTAGLVVLSALSVAYFRRKRSSSYVLSRAMSESCSALEPLEMVELPKESCYNFTIREILRATNNFSNSLLVGQGSAGKVYRGRLPSGQDVAVKCIVQKENLDSFRQEVLLLVRVRHPNLTALLGYCQHKHAYMLVYEFMSNGDLQERLGGADPLTWVQRVSIALDCARGLAFLHDYPDGAIIHRDIKPSNILLNQSLEAKLSDFGLSKLLGLEASHLSTAVKGTSGYLDPEYLLLAQITEACDVYSFGIVLLQLISGRKAIESRGDGNRSIVQELSPEIENEEYSRVADPKLCGDYSPSAFKRIALLACECVQPKGCDRPNISDVLDSLELAWKSSKGRTDGCVIR